MEEGLLHNTKWNGCCPFKRVKSARVLAFEDLGPEAIYEIEVEEFPLIVAIDSEGNTIFKE